MKKIKVDLSESYHNHRYRHHFYPTEKRNNENDDKMKIWLCKVESLDEFGGKEGGGSMILFDRLFVSFRIMLRNSFIQIEASPSYRCESCWSPCGGLISEVP